MSRRFSVGACLLAGVALMALNGCSSDDGLGARHPVSGKVTYKGQPLTKGQIFFSPAPDNKEGRGGTGEIIDGEIKSVTTQEAGDGLMPGKYNVSINALETVDVSGVMAKYKAAPDPVAVAQAQKKGKSLIPQKYSNAIDSGLTAEVTSGKNEFTFELKD
ncbi:MAG TPA: hypothetical protein VGZ22_04440 [Isosphaeraceae bacterium]|jgi:ribosomal protein L12E/L44/L45/RPP1/RPP2|nr:hypothetical protein [Isosphaeraceae bacterium]